jgi:microcystin-dependent protein
MANYEATRYDWDGEYLTGVEGVNTGVVVPWTSASIPSGFLECNGQAVSRSTYAALFAVISTSYGIGDGSTTFNVPNITDRTIVNKSNNKVLATTGGANTVTPTGNVSATIANTTLTTSQIPSHSHTGSIPSGAGPGSGFIGNIKTIGSTNTGSTGSGGAHNHSASATFTGSANSVLQPYLTLIYIIKT